MFASLLVGSSNKGIASASTLAVKGVEEEEEEEEDEEDEEDEG